MSKYQVVAAAYGALADGNPDRSEVYDVTSTLLTLLEKNGSNGNVKIDNDTFGDPAPGWSKHFGAVVIIDGKTSAFACAEGQTIDFT